MLSALTAAASGLASPSMAHSYSAAPQAMPALAVKPVHSSKAAADAAAAAAVSAAWPAAPSKKGIKASANPKSSPSPGGAAAKSKASKPKQSKSSNPPNTSGRRRRGRQKVRNMIKIPDTDEVEILCIHGCGCKYRTKVFSVDRDAWHKALRCINAHESQRCPLNKNSTRCYGKKGAGGSKVVNPRLKRKSGASSTSPHKTAATGSPAGSAPQQTSRQQQQLQQQQHAHAQQPQQLQQQPSMGHQAQQAALLAQQAHLQQQYIQAQLMAQQQQYAAAQPAPQMLYSVVPGGYSVRPQPAAGFAAAPAAGQVPGAVPAMSEQCSQFCRYRRAVAELMLENAKLKNDCARLKDLLNSVSSHLANASNNNNGNGAPRAAQTQYMKSPHQPLPAPQQQQQQQRMYPQQHMYMAAQQQQQQMYAAPPQKQQLATRT